MHEKTIFAITNSSKDMESTYLHEIRQILQDARQRTYNLINSATVEVYWKIGKRIVLQEQSGAERAAYGESLLKELSIALTTEFGKGFTFFA